MNFKALLKSKTFYTGIAGVLTGIGLIVSGQKAEGIQIAITGFIAIFLRDTLAKK